MKINHIAPWLLLGCSLAVCAESHNAAYQEALKKDAEAIAKSYKISPEDALRRLKLQEAGSNVVVPLKDEFQDRLVGIYIEHDPVDRMVLRLKGDVPVPDRTLDADGETLLIHFIHGHTHTKAELQQALDKNRAALKTAIPSMHATYTDDKTGEAVLMVDGEKNESLDLEKLKNIASGILDIPFRLERGVRAVIQPGFRRNP